MMITVTNPRFRLRMAELTLHRGLCFLRSDETGLISDQEHGFFVHQTRFLSRLKFTTHAMSSSGAGITGHNSYKATFVAPSPAGDAAGPSDEDGGEIATRAIVIELALILQDEVQFELRITNHGLCSCAVQMQLEAGADFADLQEVSGASGPCTSDIKTTYEALSPSSLLVRFENVLEALPHATELRLECNGLVVDHNPIRCHFELQSRAVGWIRGRISALFLGSLFESENDCRDWLPEATQIETGLTKVKSAWETAAADLASLKILEGDQEEQWTPVAGVPKYVGLFGRDALVTGIQALMLHPGILKGSLGLVGKWTAQCYEDRYDAQPGRVLHQRQMGPLALLGKNPFRHYWGDHSASGWFVLGTALHFLQTDDREALEDIRPKVEATLAWMDRDGDVDGDGLYEYVQRSGPKGLRNQYWKDSAQAVLHGDGKIPKAPIAAADVQGLFFAAKQAMSAVYALIGEQGRSSELLGQADVLKRKFNQQFWLEREGTYAMALDCDKQPLRSIASDPGACLAFGIIDEERTQQLASRLMQDDLFSGWGIRTLSRNHPAYNPLGYHLGSVWPMSNALVCLGMKRYGFNEYCHRIARAQFDAAELFDQYRLPELFGGYAREGGAEPPGIYGKACSPQAWSAGAVIQFIQALLGLYPVAALNAIIADPCLPPWIPSLSLKGLHFGREKVDLAFRRGPISTVVEILSGPPGLKVVRVEQCTGRDRLRLGIERAFSAFDL